MTTIRHKATGQTLEGERVAFWDDSGIQFVMGSVFTWFDKAQWEILPEPRELSGMKPYQK